MCLWNVVGYEVWWLVYNINDDDNSNNNRMVN